MYINSERQSTRLGCILHWNAFLQPVLLIEPLSVLRVLRVFHLQLRQKRTDVFANYNRKKMYPSNAETASIL
jgi:hypothetical protein